MPKRDPSLDVANASGFPLQIALEHVVRKTKDLHHWNVRYVEHSWRNRADDKSGFIDLVLRNHYGTQTLVIECKRESEILRGYFCGLMERINHVVTVRLGFPVTPMDR